MFFAPLILEGFGDGRLATRDDLRQTIILRPHTGLPVDQTPGKTLRACAATPLVVNSGSVQHKETVQKTNRIRPSLIRVIGLCTQ